MLGECLTLRAGLLARAGDPGATRDLLREAIEIYADMGDDREIRACQLLTADAWRCEGRLDQALPLVEAELPFLGEVGALDTVQSPLAARMAGWRVLAAAGDTRAPRQLELAMAELGGASPRLPTRPCGAACSKACRCIARSQPSGKRAMPEPVCAGSTAE